MRTFQNVIYNVLNICVNVGYGSVFLLKQMKSRLNLHQIADAVFCV